MIVNTCFKFWFHAIVEFRKQWGLKLANKENPQNNMKIGTDNGDILTHVNMLTRLYKKLSFLAKAKAYQNQKAEVLQIMWAFPNMYTC